MASNSWNLLWTLQYGAGVGKILAPVAVSFILLYMYRKAPEENLSFLYYSCMMVKIILKIVGWCNSERSSLSTLELNHFLTLDLT